MPLAKIFILFFSLFQFLAFGSLDRIQRALERGEYEKAEGLILKGYQKEPKNPGLSFFHAKLLFTPAYQRYNPDSARVVLQSATQLFQNATDKIKSELSDAGILERDFSAFSTQIRDHLFQETLKDLSVSSVAAYLAKYPETVYENILVFKRDSLMFDKAKNLHTKEAYVSFITSHPTSIFRMKADSLLDDLRYQELKESGTLQDYYEYQLMYPNSPALAKVEQYILSLSTASNSVDKYEQFILSAKTEKWKKRAADVLYYVSNRQNIEYHPFRDSIVYAQELSKKWLFPIMESDYFGFNDSNGTPVIRPIYDSIQSHAKCSTIADDWIFIMEKGEGKIIKKDGEIILPRVSDYRNLSADMGLVRLDEDWFLYHKSGFNILNFPVENAEVFANNWIKVQNNGQWGLYTVFGVSIADIRYDDIYQMGPYWVFERNGLLAVYTEEKILKEIETRGLALEFKFDDLELVDGNLIGFRDTRECLLDSNLNFLIPWGSYEIFPDPAGWYLKSDQGYYLYNNTDEQVMNRNYPYLESNPGWLALKTEDDWILIARNSYIQLSRGYDSLKLINPYAALTIKGKERKLLFSNAKIIDLQWHQIKTFPNHPNFLSISHEGALGLYNGAGERILDGRYESITFLSDSLVKVSSGNKVGLISIKGEFILNPIFDTIDEKDGLAITLYRGKIGCYDLAAKVLIPPNYESRITKVGGYYFVKKGGSYGLINRNEDIILNFSYQEINTWNDSSYLVKSGGQYAIINQKEEPLIEGIEQLQLLYEDDGEQLYKFVKNGKFGLMSNRLGLILKPEFTDLFHIGNRENPLFFADQHLDQAGFHVVSYVNKTGEIVYSKAYRKEEFNRIICDD